MNEKLDVTGVTALVEQYETLRAQAEELEGELKELKSQRDAAEREVIRALLDAMEQTGVDDLTVKVGGYKYGASAKEYYSIPKEAQAEAFPLLRELNMGDLIVERVDDRTLSKELRDVMDLYAATHPEEAGRFPMEYEPLLAQLKRYVKPALTRRKA